MLIKLDRPRGGFAAALAYAADQPNAQLVAMSGLTSVACAAAVMTASAARAVLSDAPVQTLLIAYAAGEHPTRRQLRAHIEHTLAVAGCAGRPTPHFGTRRGTSTS